MCCTRLLPADGDGYILVMNDKTLEFSSKLSQFYDACKIVAGTPGLQSAGSYSVPKGLKILEKLADPSSLITGLEHKLPVPWTQLKRVFWFADFDNDESDSEQALLHKFFADIAIKILSERLSDLQVILIMKNTRYIQLQVSHTSRLISNSISTLDIVLNFEIALAAVFSGGKIGERMLLFPQRIVYV